MRDSQELAAEPARKRRLGKVNDVAEVLSVSDRHVYRLNDAGKMPQPIKLGGAVRWDMELIQDWIAAGCPAVDSRQGSR
jgi:excisionase family DNA binding protein